MFWMKKEKTPLGYRELAMDLKREANDIVADYFCAVTLEELTTLYALVSYMDTFILKCLSKDNKLINRLWILARLVEARTILKSTKNKNVVRVIAKLEALEGLILAGERNDERGKIGKTDISNRHDKNSGGGGPAPRRKKP